MAHAPIVDFQTRYVKALRTQSGESFPCPFGHQGRVFQSKPQLLDHVRTEHANEIADLTPTQAREHVFEAVRSR